MVQVIKKNGSKETFDTSKIKKCVQWACEGLQDVNPESLVESVLKDCFNGITTKDIDKLAILTARSKIELEPNYNYVAARLLLNLLYKEVFEGFKGKNLEGKYIGGFKENIEFLVKQERLSPKLLEFDLDRLSKALCPDRDFKFKYLGLQTLYDRYFIHVGGRRLETPQYFFMRVAMGLSLNEKDKESSAIEFYEEFSQFNYLPSTPTLFNSGTNHPQLSSCYLSTLEDSINGIFDCVHQQALLSKFAGGLSVDWTPVRATNSYVKGTNGNSQGLIPWLKIFNDTLVAVNQGGKRKGSGCAYLEPWHDDIEDFIELRKNTGDDRRRCHDMNTALWIPDLFMEMVESDKDWYLFSPSDTPDLHDLYGNDFKERYNYYVEKIGNRKIKAKILWKKILTLLLETGHPWICFKDTSNIRYTDKHCGVVHCSNLCTEILRHNIATTYKEDRQIDKLGETAVCNLASINLKEHLINIEGNNSIDWEKLKNTIRVAIKGLDNVIDINFYPTKESENSNLKHRPIGLGEMGYADILHDLGINYGEESAKLAGEIQEFISYWAIFYSCELSIRKGPYPTFENSEWSKGNFPIDTYIFLHKYRSLDGFDSKVKLDWEYLKNLVNQYGIRNSNMQAIAPTATISYIAGCSQSIEPDYSVLFVYSTLSGNFTLVNEYFVAEMKRCGLWGVELLNQIKQNDGDISKLSIPKKIKEQFKTAFDIDYKDLIDAAAERQKWIDMGQSLNLYTKSKSLKHLNDIYFYAWNKGLKTTYYLRSKAASTTEKVTSDKKEEKKQCSIDNPNCESCQ